MRELDFTLSGQKLAKQGDFSGITAGSKGYLKCRFAAEDNDWRMAKKVAIFGDTVLVKLDANGECMVPDEMTDRKSFKVKVAGERTLPGGNTVRMMTNAVLIEQVV